MPREAPVLACRHFSRQTLHATDPQAGVVMGEMKQAEARYKDEFHAKQDRFAYTLVIAAAITAAVRLAREEQIGSPSPRVVSVVGDSVSLAKMILERVMR